MKIMVTGGSGFMGSHLVKELAMRGDEPVIFDIFSPFGVKKALLSQVEDKIKFVRGNFLDLPSIVNTIKKNEIDKVVHLARYLSSPVSVKEPMMAKSDIEGTLTMLEAGRLTEVKRIVFMSSQAVYGPKQYDPVDEDHPKFPASPYGTYKLASEYFGLNYCELYGVDFVAIRPSNPYGLGQPYRKNIDFIVQNAVNGVPVRLTTGGSVCQDALYVKDLINGILLALDVNKTRLHHRIFNIAYGEVVRISEVGEIVKELVPEAVIEIGEGMSEQQAKRRSSRGPYSIERARKELGYKPKYDLRTAITDYLEYGRTHLSKTKEHEDVWSERI